MKHEIEELNNRSKRSIRVFLYVYLVDHILYTGHFFWFDFNRSLFALNLCPMLQQPATTSLVV